MDFKNKDTRIDGQLSDALHDLNRQIDTLCECERTFLDLEGNKKPMLASLTLRAEGKSFAEREAKAYASEDYKSFLRGLHMVEAEYNRAKRRYELLMKAFDAAYLSLKTETAGIRRQGA